MKLLKNKLRNKILINICNQVQSITCQKARWKIVTEIENPTYKLIDFNIKNEIENELLAKKF